MSTKEKPVESNDELFNKDNIPASNWFKFQNVGDRVSGEVVEITEKKSNNTAFKDQRVFVLRQKDGSLVNVGFSVDKDYIIGRTNRVVPGDILGFEFKKEVPSSLGKGYAPAKSIEVYVKHVEKHEEAA